MLAPQIILGWHFLAIARCKIDVKQGKWTFDVGEYYAEFSLFKYHGPSPSALPCCGCDVVVSDKTVESFDVCPNDLYEFDYVSIESRGLNYAKVDLVDHLPPSIVKDKPI